MAAPSYTYTLTNSTTADASQVQQNFTDILNGVSDGTKDLSINALTCAGAATLNGHVNLGNATADDLTITASLAATLAIKTNNSFDIGSATLGLASVYLGAPSSRTTRLRAYQTLAASYTLTFPDSGPTAGQIIKSSDTAGSLAWTARNVVPTVQLFTSGSAATYTTPVGVLYIIVRLVGGGGGGAGSGLSGTAGAGGAGGATTFGTTLLNGGAGGAGQAGNGNVTAGGTISYGAATDFGSMVGGPGAVGTWLGGVNTDYCYGGIGGISAFGGSSVSATNAGTNAAPQANSGGGGAGGNAGATVNVLGGNGGGAGGYVYALIITPSATYTYTVGAGGAAGTAGTSGNVGTAGAAGKIIVEEYYL